MTSETAHFTHESAYRGLLGLVRRSVARHPWVVLSVGVLAMVLIGLASRATAGPPTPPALTSAASASATTVRVQFSEPVFTDTSAATGDRALAPGDFSLDGGAAGAGISAVSQGGARDVWTLTLAAPASPDATLAVVADEVFTGSDEALVSTERPIDSLTPGQLADVVAEMNTLGAIDLFPADSYVSPIGPVTAGDTLADYLALDTLPTAPANEGELIGALDALNDTGGPGASITAGTLTLPLAVVTDVTVPVTFGLDTIGLSLATQDGAEMAVTRTLGGTLSLSHDGGAATLDTTASNLTVDLDATGAFDAVGRLGFAEVTARQIVPTLDAAFALDLVRADSGVGTPDQVPAAQVASTVALTGSAQLGLDTFEVAGLTGPISAATTVSWDLAAPDAGPSADLTTFAASSLANFTNIDAQNVLAGLASVSAWLSQVERYGALGAELPLVGDAAGEVVDITARMNQAVEYVEQGVEAFSTGDDDPSIADVAELLCGAGLFGEADCEDVQEVLAPLSISAEEITYALSLTTVLDPFDTGNPDAYVLRPNDVCRAIAEDVGTTSARFRIYNPQVLTRAACDQLTAGDVVNTQLPDLGSGTPAPSRVLTHAHVCGAVAAIFDVTPADFIAYNGFADNAACAAAVASAVGDPAANPLVFDDTPEAGPSLDFALGDQLEGLDVGIDGSVAWDNPTATIELNLTLGVKIGSQAAIEADLVFDPDDWDGDGVRNSDDDDADGDGAPDASTDRDDDADGLPEDYSLRENDVCRAIAGTVARQSTSDFISANADVADTAACDQLEPGDTITVGDSSQQLTAGDVCRSVANLFGVAAADFRTYNGFADNAACAATITAIVDGSTTRLVYDPTLDYSPFEPGHRLFVAADPSTPLARVQLDLSGAASARAHLGILDLNLDGDATIAPEFTIDLADPGTSADDAKIDLVELAETVTADSSAAIKLDTLVDLGISGEIDAHVLVGSDGLALSGADRLRLDVVGNLSALDNVALDGDDPVISTLAKAIDSSDAASDDLSADVAEINWENTDTIYVGTDLDELLALEDVSPAQLVAMVRALAEQVDELAGTDLMSQRLPLIDTTVAELVDLVETFATVAEQVENRGPDDLVALNQIIAETLADLGVPDAVSLEVTASDLRLGFAVDESVSADYPLAFELEDFPVAPTDGGVTIGVTAGVTMSPTVGLRFDDALDLDQRVFITADSGPTFTADFDADLEGAVAFGPFEAAVEGTAVLDASVTVGLLDPGVGQEADGLVTVRELLQTLGSSTPTDVVTVELDGPVTADLDGTVSVPLAGDITGAIKVRGDLTALGSADPFEFVATEGALDPTSSKIQVFSDIDTSGLSLDLDTFVTGAIETARFVGRGLQDSEELDLDIPVVGDVLTSLSPLGDDIVEVADEVDSLWNGDSQQFRNAIENALEDTLCATARECVTVDVTDRSGQPTSLSDADEFKVSFTLSDKLEGTRTLDGGIDLEPVFGLDFSTVADVTLGYSFDVAFGVSRADGFFVEGGRAIEIYGKVGALDIDAAATLLEVGEVTITDGTARIKGTSGPDNDAAGFALCLLDCTGTPRLTMSDITNRARKASELFVIRPDVVVDIDLPIRTELAGLPTLAFPLVFDWTIDSFDLTTPSLTVGTAADPVTLDVSGFVDGVILPALEGLEEYNPLSKDPISDILTSEIPVLDANLRDLAQAYVDTVPDQGVKRSWAVFTFLVDLPCTIADLKGETPPTDCGASSSFGSAAGVIDLGWVEVLPTFVGHPSSVTPASATDPAPAARSGSGPAAAGTSPVDKLRAIIDKLNTGPTGQPMFSLPILDNPLDVMKLVLGGELDSEVTFIEFTPGPIRVGPQLSFKQTVGFDAGFLDGDLTVGVDGFLGLEINLGVGLDSSGLAPGKSFEDGFYLVDFTDDDASDFEVAVGGKIDAFVEGRVSVLGGLADVSFRGSGGVNLTGGLDFNDESIAVPAAGRGDGKFHLDEIATVIEAHGGGVEGLPCLFNLGIKFNANISFAGKAKVLGVTVFNDSFSESLTILDEQLSCTPDFRVAQLVDGRLILNAGPTYAADRFDGRGDIAERFSVTRGGQNDENYVVTLVGESGYAPATFPVSSVTSIYGDLGVGDDSVTVADDITVPVVLDGGPGADVLRGGSGPDRLVGGPNPVSKKDELYGGLGADVLDGGPGADLLRGNGGPDTLGGGAGGDDLDGGPGPDLLDGGVAADTYAFSGSFGADTVRDEAGRDTLDLSSADGPLTGTSSFGEARIAEPTGRSVTYLTNQIDLVIGSPERDTFALTSSLPDGFEIDGRGGGDTYVADLAGTNRTITVDDTAGAGDTLTVNGTVGANEFLLRKADSGVAFVALLSKGRVDRVTYDSGIEKLNVNGLAGKDTFSLDDNAARTTIDAGPGHDVVQVGQIFGRAGCTPTSQVSKECPGDTTSHRGSDPDQFDTRVITRGHLSNGVTRDLDILGGTGEDRITVFSNRARVTADGGPDNDRFVARAFILTDSLVLNGEGGIDDFTYVVNDLLSVDGGDGTDTYSIIGTEADDGFIVDTDTDGNAIVQLCKLDPATGRPDANQCAIDSLAESIEVFELMGLEGDDVFWIRSSDPRSAVIAAGGANADRFLVSGRSDGPDEPITLDGIRGPLTLSGDASGNVPDIARPRVLPGEDTTAAFEPEVTGGTARGDTVEIDATGAGDLTGELTDTAIRGLGMADGPFAVGAGPDAIIYPEVLSYGEMEFLDLRLGDGDDDVTVKSTHVGNTLCDTDGCPLRLDTSGGGDDVDVWSISGQTRIFTGAGQDDVSIGRPGTTGDVLDDIDAGLSVDGGGDADDTLELDHRAAPAARLDVGPGAVTRAGLAPPGVDHRGVETVDIRLGDEPDTVNVRGTAADATQATTIHTNGGDDRFFVSSAARLTPTTDTDHLGGDVEDVQGPLVLKAGAGDRQKLLVSDREAASGDGDVRYDGRVLTGMAPASITHGAVGGAFGHGITLWSSELADSITVNGADRTTRPGVSTLTTLNTGDGRDEVGLELAAPDHGPFVLNTEEGDDVVTDLGSSLDLVVFGGLGGDEITTGSGDDLVVGDRGVLTAADGGTVAGNGGPGDVSNGAPRAADTVESEVDGAAGGPDVISTGSGRDAAIGGPGRDEIRGDDDEDLIFGDSAYIERTDGVPRAGHTVDPATGTGDDLFGGSDDDVVLGGHGADTISGGDDDDVLLGDHGEWNPVGPGSQVFRSLHEEANKGGGADTIHGDDGDDVVLGQQARDTLFGDAGEDDLTGGHNVVGGDDTGDEIHGGADADAVLGDNGIITRMPLDGGGWLRHPAPFDDVVRELVRYDDVDEVSGGDEIHGDAGDDRIEGQRGDDELSGGPGDDELVGGLGADEISGGAHVDVILGDVGSITRASNDLGLPRVDASGAWHRDILLEEVGVVTGAVSSDTTPLRDDDADLAERLTAADLLLLTGTVDADGEKVLATDSGAWETDVLLVDLMTADADDLAGDAGDDIVFGQRGDDTVAGGEGDDLLVGDNGTNTLPFRTDLPQIARGVRVISAAPDLDLDIDALGDVVVPTVQTSSHWFGDEALAATVTAGVVEQFGALHRDGLTRAADGATLRPLVSAVPDIVHHPGVQPGNDVIDGDGGDDVVVGDDLTVTAALLEGPDELDDVMRDVGDVVRGLGVALDRLGVDVDLWQHEVDGGGHPSDRREVRVGSDEIRAGAGRDTVSGDNATVVVPWQASVPIDGEDFESALLDVHAVARDIEHVAADATFVVGQAHGQVLHALVDDAARDNPERREVKDRDLVAPDHHVLTIGDDVVRGGDGADTIAGHDVQLLMAQVTAGAPDSKGEARYGLDEDTFEDAEDALDDDRETRDDALEEHVERHHQEMEEAYPSEDDLEIIAFHWGYQTSLDNDDLAGQDGSDVVIGDDSRQAVVVAAEAARNKAEAKDIKKQAQRLAHDLKHFVDDVLNLKHADDGPYADDDLHRASVKDSPVRVDASSDVVAGNNGDDVLVADDAAFAVGLAADTGGRALTAKDLDHLRLGFHRGTPHDAGWTDDITLGRYSLDVLSGGNGADLLVGQKKADSFEGGPGKDTVKKSKAKAMTSKVGAVIRGAAFDALSGGVVRLATRASALGGSLEGVEGFGVTVP